MSCAMACASRRNLSDIVACENISEFNILIAKEVLRELQKTAFMLDLENPLFICILAIHLLLMD